MLFYLSVFGFFFVASICFPVPEEVLTVALGSLIFVGISEQGLELSPVAAALAAALGIYLSDLVVFFVGYKLNAWVSSSMLFRKKLRRRRSDLVRQWIERYGHWAAAIFRLIPAMRWPGHLACGMFRVNPTKFIIADGIAAFLYTPPQVLLVSYYGDEIVRWLTQYRGLAASLFVGLVVLAVYSKWKFKQRSQRQQRAQAET